jgi:hypothetical protein
MRFKQFFPIIALLTFLPSVALGELSEPDRAQIRTVSINNNPGAENGTAGWAAYNGGTTAPTTMTGGTPTGNVTWSRTTTVGEVLQGNASFKFVKAAANAQGDGYSTLITIPARARAGSIQIPFKIISGSLVQGTLKAFCYDITNSSVITPFGNDVISGPMVTASFPIPSNTTSLRCGLHFASTVTTAVTAAFEFRVFEEPVAVGLAGSDTAAYTPTFTGFGSPTNINIYTARVGDRQAMQGYFTPGTTTATAATMTIGGTIDSSKMSSAEYQVVGRWERKNSTGTNVKSGPMIARGGDTTCGFATDDTAGTNHGFTILTASSFFSSGENVAFHVTGVPITGWSSNVSIGQSSTFKISSYLATGSRVTGSAPTALGQYRSYIRAGTSTTYSETNGTPTAAPSASNGIALYQSTAWTTADPSGQPSKYEIFVGKNKNVKSEFYLSTGRTGFIDVTPSWTTSTNTGFVQNYDPTTGIYTVVKFWNTSGTGYSGGNDAGLLTTTPFYFDLVVSENALAVGIASPRSYIKVEGGTSYGSTDTMIYAYTTVVENVGTAIVRNTTAANGDTYTLTEDGMYRVDVSINGTATIYGGVSINSTQLTTAIDTITNTTRLCSARTTISNHPATPGRTFFGRAGDVIRVHGDASARVTAAYLNWFSIEKVSN